PRPVPSASPGPSRASYSTSHITSLFLPLRRIKMRTATSLFAILLGVSALPKIPQAQAQTLNVLHSFTGAPDGAFPMASLVRDKEGNLYGTTQGGGGVPVEKQVGTVFKLETSGNETVLHTFGESGDDGQLPVAGLVREKAGNL